MTRLLAAIVAASVLAAACSDDTDAAPDPPTTSEADAATSTTSTVVPAEPVDEPRDIDRPAPEEGAEPESIGPLADADLEIETDEGTATIGSAEVPDGLPDGFPLPDDIVGEIAVETGDETAFTGSTEVPFDQLVALYDDGLPAAGLTVDDRRVVDGSLAVYEFSGGAVAGQLAISRSITSNTGWSVLVTVGPADAPPEG